MNQKQFRQNLIDRKKKKLEIRTFVEDHVPAIHKSGRQGVIMPIFTSKKAQYETIEMLTNGIYDKLININIIS